MYSGVLGISTTCVVLIILGKKLGKKLGEKLTSGCDFGFRSRAKGAPYGQITVVFVGLGDEARCSKLAVIFGQ